MRTERNVMIAASKSSPECNASDRTPKLPVRTTKNVLRETSSRAEPTLKSAARFFSLPSPERAVLPISYLVQLRYLKLVFLVHRAALACEAQTMYFLAGYRETSMIRRAFLSIVLASLFAACNYAQAPAPPPAAIVWNALSSPAMDPAKSAHTENVEIARDRVHITLIDGTIQFAQPVNGVTFGAAFHGKGRVRVEPPNPIEAQQLKLHTKQDKLDIPFTDAT